MGTKTSGHVGQRRIFFILDRATKKFHGDVALWMQYVEYARKHKANKKISQILASVLRLHPTKPELWIYAANYAMDVQGDISEARSYMQRGLRFCKTSRNLWLEYAKLETIYVAKITARRRILGLERDYPERDQISVADDDSSDAVALPILTAMDVNPDLQEDESIDWVALQNLSATPALSGTIPMTIFDTAMRQFPGDDALGKKFFDMVAEFEGIPCLNRILQHIVSSLTITYPTRATALSCFIRQPMIGINTKSPEFPGGLRTVLVRLKSMMQTTLSSDSSQKPSCQRSALAHQMIDWLIFILDVEGLDSDIHKVLAMTLKKTWTQYLDELQQGTGEGVNQTAELLECLKSHGRRELAEIGLVSALQKWPDHPHLLIIRDNVIIQASRN